MPIRWAEIYGSSATTSVASLREARFLSATTAEDGQVTLSWYAPAGGATATNYKIYRSTSAGVSTSGTPLATVTTTSYTDTSVSNGTSYHYAVIAENSTGEAEASNEADALPIDPASPADASNLFVDFGAAPGGDGSYSLPYDDLATAITAANAGGTINIFDGALSASGSYTLTKAVTIRSLTGDYRNSNVVMTGPYPTVGPAFYINADGVAIKGIEVTNYTADGIFYTVGVTRNDFSLMQSYIHDVYNVVLVHWNGGTGWNVHGNYVKNVLGTNMTAFIFWNMPNSYSSVTYNEIDTATWSGIMFDGSSPWESLNNIISNTSEQGIQIANACAYLTITRNTITHGSLSSGGWRRD